MSKSTSPGKGCGMGFWVIFLGCIALFGISQLLDRPSVADVSDAPVVELGGIVRVFDRDACAIGPQLKIQSSDGFVRYLNFAPADQLPCLLTVSGKMRLADRYTFTVEKLPSVTLESANMPRREGRLVADVTVRG